MAELEAEAFLLGIWRDFEELESNISMPELTTIIKAGRDKDHRNQKFLAALQGVDLENEQKDAVEAFEAVKARVMSKGKAGDPEALEVESKDYGVDYEVAGDDFKW